MSQPTTTPQIGSTHQYGNASTMKITGIPSRKPKMKPKLIISRSSRLPTSSNTRLASSGWASRWRITMIFGSSTWSMFSAISPVMISSTISGSCSRTRAWTASRTRGGRSCQSCACSRSMIRSTTSWMSAWATVITCSAIASGSSCW